MKTINWLTAFVKRAVALDADAGAELTPTQRDQIIETLERCASHGPLLKQYLAAIQGTLDGNIRYNGFLTIEQADRVANEGLAVLNDGDLVRVALDPVSMWTVHEAVCENVSERWTNRVIEADEEFSNLGLLTDETSQPARAGFPWDKLDLVSPESLSALLGSVDTASCARKELSLPRGRAAASMTQSPSQARPVPTAQLAASQARPMPNEPCLPTLDIIRKYGTPYTFAWREASYALSTDANAVVYVGAPSSVTHLRVGDRDLYPLQSSDIEGLFVVSGLKRAQLRRRIEAGETVTFWSQDMEDK